MAKQATLTTITAGYGSYSQHNTNYSNLNTALSNTLSLDGSTPNSMLADFDLNSNDLLNGGNLSATDITIGGISLAAQVAAAAASATAAAASATAAAASATSAASSYDSFDDRYLGAKSSAPSTDNDGDALTAGVLYYNTTDGNMYVHNGTSWGNLTVPTNFTDLADVDTDYTGDALKVVRVNAGETGLEFASVAATVSDADYGDITVSSSGTVWTIDDNAVDLAAMAHGTQGDIIYMGASGAPAYLGASTSGLALLTSGAGFNPVWGQIRGTAIAMGSDAQGDILYHNGTSYARLAAGTSGKFLKTQGAGANPTWDTAPGGASGSIYQVQHASNVTAGSTSTTIPVDNTIPQNTEGAEVETVAITPSNASSVILVEATLTVDLSNNGTYCTAALFVDSNANAIATAVTERDSSAGTATITVKALHSPGDTSSHTYKLRVGPSGGTAYYNRISTTANVHSTAGPGCVMTATEILP